MPFCPYCGSPFIKGINKCKRCNRKLPRFIIDHKINKVNTSEFSDLPGFKKAVRGESQFFKYGDEIDKIRYPDPPRIAVWWHKRKERKAEERNRFYYCTRCGKKTQRLYIHGTCWDCSPNRDAAIQNYYRRRRR